MSIRTITDVHGHDYYLYNDYNGDSYYYYFSEDNSKMLRCTYKEPNKWAYEYQTGVYRTRSGLPIDTNRLPISNRYVIGTQFLLATLGLLLNSLCIYFVYRKPQLGKSVRFIILLDAIGRLIESLTFFYQGSCQATWHCVRTTGFFIAPILINRIVTAIGNGMIVSMLLLLHCLSINRTFAVFFKGRYYQLVQKITFPYSAICYVIPLVFHFLNIKDLPDPKTDSVCYSGLFYDPSKFMAHLAYYTGSYQIFYQRRLAYFLGGFLVLPLILDVFTVIWIRQLVKSSDAKKRGDFRLSIMMLINCLIWVADIVMHYYLYWTIPGGYGSFFTYEAWPTLGHCALCVITILFNLPPRKRRQSIQTVSLVK